MIPTQSKGFPTLGDFHSEFKYGITAQVSETDSSEEFTTEKYVIHLNDYKKRMASIDELTDPRLKKLQELLNANSSNPRQTYIQVSNLLDALSNNYDGLRGPNKDFFERVLRGKFESNGINDLFTKWIPENQDPKDYVKKSLCGTEKQKGVIPRLWQSFKGNLNKQNFLEYMNVPHLRATIETKDKKTFLRHACPTPTLDLTIGQIVLKTLSNLGVNFLRLISFNKIKLESYHPDQVSPQFRAYLKLLKTNGETVVYSTLQTPISPKIAGIWRNESSRVKAIQKAVEAEGHYFLNTSLDPKKKSGYASFAFSGKKDFDFLKQNLLDAFDSQSAECGFIVPERYRGKIELKNIITTLKNKCYSDISNFDTTAWNGFVQNVFVLTRLKLLTVVDANPGKPIHVFASCMDDIDRGGNQYALERKWLAKDDEEMNRVMREVYGRLFMVKSRGMVKHWEERMENALERVPKTHDERKAFLENCGIHLEVNAIKS
ncbi:MAG: hypothetical protein ACOYK9_05145 [Chlamydiia bacterium]